MISSIGFVPSGISMQNLKRFVPDEEIADSLRYLDIPIVDTSEKPCDDDVEESEEIVENDVMIFCTPNEDDVSFLQFHIHNSECTNMFLHHDVYVFSTITDSSLVEIGNELYVGLSTFENDIMLFDPFVRNPMLPQILLRGHVDSVLSLKYHDHRLVSGGSDAVIAEWDVERGQVKDKTVATGPVSNVAVLDSGTVYSVNDVLYCLRNEARLGGDVEKIRTKDNGVLVSDSTGVLRHYDLRNMSTFVKEKKVHEDSITGVDVLGDTVYTASMDGSVKTVDLLTFETKSTWDSGEKLFSLGVHGDGFYVCGGESNELMLRAVDITS